MVKTYGQTPRQLFRTSHPMVVQNLLREKDDNIQVIKGDLNTGLKFFTFEYDFEGI